MSAEAESNIAAEQEGNEVDATKEDEDDADDEETRNMKEEMGLTEVESLCMNCMENGMTRFMIHKIPYFRELVIASFECEHCGERNNEVTFGGEIQVQGCAYQLEVTCERDLNSSKFLQILRKAKYRQLKDLYQLVRTNSTLDNSNGRSAARNLGLFQRERMEENPEAGVRVAEIIVELGRMTAGLSFPFIVIVDDCAGNSFVENLFAPHPDPRMSVRHYNKLEWHQNISCRLIVYRTPEQDMSLGLQPEHGTYRDDSDTNVKTLIGGEFGGLKLGAGSGGEDGGEEQVHLGRQEIVSIPDHCPSCNCLGESLTALTDIPHFKEVIIMAFTCSECGYKNSEVKGGGAVPAKGNVVTLYATSEEDLKRDMLKSDSAMVRIEELDMELSYGTLGGVYTTVEGLLQKIESNLRDSNPFMLGDSSTKHHSEELQIEKPKDKFTEMLDKLRDLYLGKSFPFTLVVRDPLGNSFVSAQIGTFTPPEADPGLTISDYERSFEENETFGLNDMNTRDFETGVDYDENILPDRITHVVPKGMDHPTPFAQGMQDSTPSGMYFAPPVRVSGPAEAPALSAGELHGWTSVGPSWGPESLARDLGVIPPKPRTEENFEDDSATAEEIEYTHPRQFHEEDFTIQFKPREEFGHARPGFVFRMGGQGLGYYEDIRADKKKTEKTPAPHPFETSAPDTSTV